MILKHVRVKYNKFQNQNEAKEFPSRLRAWVFHMQFSKGSRISFI
jgi:hypothetical protein